MDDLRLELDIVGITCIKCPPSREVRLLENAAEMEAFIKRHMTMHFSFADFSQFEVLCRIATPGQFNGKHVTLHWRKE